jgi:hypothetical protein
MSVCVSASWKRLFRLATMGFHVVVKGSLGDPGIMPSRFQNGGLLIDFSLVWRVLFSGRIRLSSGLIDSRGCPHYGVS